MRNLAIRKYLVRIFIYTVVYVIVALVMDWGFNGVVVEQLNEILPHWLFELIWDNIISVALLVYIAGLLVISIIQVIRLSRLLRTASQAVTSDDLLNEENCPVELQELSLKLREFKQNAKANEEARKSAEQQKNDLIVYLAHDLKTPLTSIIGYLSLLEESPDIPIEQRSKYTGIALDKAYRLELLINEFFEITRLNLQTVPTHKTPINLTVLLLQVLSEFYPMFESKNMTVEQAVAPELKIVGDADKLARVFENLLKNAVNYGYENSCVKCRAFDYGRYVVVKISNQGNNIPPEKLSRIFDKFYRLDDARQSNTGGTGLGLAISKQIVEMHNGTISVTSENNITEFTVAFPL